MAQLVKDPPAMWETWVGSLGWEDALEKATHSNILSWRIPWTVYSPWGLKELDTTERPINYQVNFKIIKYILKIALVYIYLISIMQVNPIKIILDCSKF